MINALVSSGLSLVQADAVMNLKAGTANAADLAAAGFSTVQVATLVAEAANPANVTDADLTAAGFWAGTQVPAINAVLA